MRDTEQKPVDPKINRLFSAPEARGFKGLPEGAERVPQRLFTSWKGLRQHPLPNGGLEVGQHADEQGHGDAVPEGEAEEVAFLPDHAGGGGGHADGLGRNHLAGDAAGGVHGYGEFGGHTHGLRGGALHTAEEGVRRGVGAGQEHAEPTQDRGEEREQAAGLGEADAEGRAHTGVVHEEGQTEDGGDGQDGETELVNRGEEAGHGLAEAVLGHEGHGEEAGQQDGGSACGEPSRI